MARKVICPECEKKLDWRGLSGHMRFEHQMTTDQARAASKNVEPFEDDEPKEDDPEDRVVALLEEISARIDVEGPSAIADEEEGELPLSQVVLEALRRLRAISDDRQLIEWALSLEYDVPRFLTEKLSDQMLGELSADFEELRQNLNDLSDAYEPDLQKSPLGEFVVDPTDWPFVSGEAA